ncbi:hypothetical protein I4F81_010474 [Pyropia yezoensis]|uniref:Uncharacterized protein n=1 Tax=Pyropia yezoensis TaxID=2788 RepID=A0ACC3CCS6_PYRYE|nr:hypothetical protein I4F81_010474 [Neopyropia yezoensis]
MVDVAVPAVVVVVVVAMVDVVVSLVEAPSVTDPIMATEESPYETLIATDVVTMMADVGIAAALTDLVTLFATPAGLARPPETLPIVVAVTLEAPIAVDVEAMTADVELMAVVTDLAQLPVTPLIVVAVRLVAPIAVVAEAMTADVWPMAADVELMAGLTDLARLPVTLLIVVAVTLEAPIVVDAEAMTADVGQMAADVELMAGLTDLARLPVTLLIVVAVTLEAPIVVDAEAMTADVGPMAGLTDLARLPVTLSVVADVEPSVTVGVTVGVAVVVAVVVAEVVHQRERVGRVDQAVVETATVVASLAAVLVVVLAPAERVGPADRAVVETAMAVASLMTVVLTATLGPHPECPGAEDSFLLVDGANRLTALRELHKEGHANAVGEVQVTVIVRRDGQPLTLMMALTLGVRANSTAAKAKEMSDVDDIHFIKSWLREYNDRQPLGKKQSLIQHSMSDLIHIFYNYMDNRKQDPTDVDLAHRESDEVDREQEDQDDATAWGGPEASRIGKAVLQRMIKIVLIYIEDERSGEYIIKRITDSVGSRGEHALTTESCASPALCTLGGVPLVYCTEVRLWMLQVGWE